MDSSREVSVICVYNDKEIYNKQLIQSLSLQDIKFEMIGLDNTQNKFQSAAEALNYGVKKSKGNILVFSHQDIFLKTKNELKNFVNAIAKLEVGSIVGTQGAKAIEREHYSNLTSGLQYNEQIIDKYPLKLIQVSCVDEGLFGMKRDTWLRHEFNEKLCNNWHLYCVEMCLNARNNGFGVYVFPIQLHHFSKGKISIGYMTNLVKIADYYRPSQKYIWTTCYKVPNSWLYVHILRIAWIINRKIRGRSLD